MPKNILAVFWRKKFYHRIDRFDRKKPEECFPFEIPEPEVEKRLLKTFSHTTAISREFFMP